MDERRQSKALGACQAMTDPSFSSNKAAATVPAWLSLRDAQGTDEVGSV